MTGSLQIKANKYYIVLNTYENGKRKPKWISTGLPAKGNKRKAEQMLRDAIRQEELCSGIVPSDVTFADYVRLWLQQVKRRVDEVTHQGYEAIALGHVIPYFERTGIQLQKVTRAQLQAYIDEKAASGRKDGRGGLSARSLRLHKNILYQALTEAVKNELIPANPCQYVELPPAVRYEAKYYTAEQLHTLLSAIEKDPLAPMIAVTIIYGLRRSELLGLKWDSIDFDSKLVTIKHTVSKVTAVVEKDKTKNASSRRSFPLTDEARAIFLQAKVDEDSNRRLMGKGYQQNDYVFKWPDGRPFSPDYVSRHFSILLKNNGLPHIRFHELRHSCASLLLNQGFTLKDVQEWMEHSDIKMTANIYGHLDVARKQNMAGVMSGLLNTPDTERC